MTVKLTILSAVVAMTVFGASVHTPARAADGILVTPDNFNRAETDLIFAGNGKRQGIGKFLHYREPMSIEFPIVRPNRDTLYSLSVFDLDAGPMTVTLPDAGAQFMSMQVIERTITRPRSSTGPARTRIPERRSAPAISRLGSAYSSIQMIRRMSSRFIPCRTRSRSRSPAVRAGSKSPTGIKQARRRSATPF